MKYHLMIAFLCSLPVGLSTFSVHPTGRVHQQSEEVRTLTSGAPVEREISGGQSQVWQINLSSGDYLRLTVREKTGELAGSLFAPAGVERGNERKPLLSSAEENIFIQHDANLREVMTFSLIAEISGVYSLETSLDKNSGPTRYEVEIEALRSATPNDRLRVAAERAELAADKVIDGETTLEGQMRDIANYETALALWRELGDRRSELRLLRMIEKSYLPLGELQTALKYNSQALTLVRELGDRYQEANLLLGFGHIQQYLGNHQQALDVYQKAREIFRGLSKRFGEATALDNIGNIYLEIGEERQALAYFDKVLPIYTSLGATGGRLEVLNNMGIAHNRLGERQEAIELLTRALDNPDIRKLRSQVEAQILGNLGRVYFDLGDKQKATDYFTRELSICRKLGARTCMTTSLNSLGDVSFSVGEKEKSLDYFHDSLNLSRITGESEREATALQGLARTNYALGNLSEARKQIEMSLEIRESQRANLARQDMRASFFGSAQNGFELYIDLLMTQHQREPGAGHDAEALQACERARARSLLEQLAESGLWRAGLHESVDPQLLELDHDLRQQLDAKAIAHANALNKKASESLAKSFEKEIEDLTSRYREVEERIREASPRYAALTRPQPLTAAEIQQQLLDDDTVLLEYALGEKRSWLWTVTRNSLASYELPPRAQIETASRQVYELLTERQPKDDKSEDEQLQRIAAADAEFPAATAELSRMLLGPIYAQLRQEWNGKRLAIVAAGALDYLPFAALPLPEGGGRAGEWESGRVGETRRQGDKGKENPPGDRLPLIASHEVVYFPSASALAELRRETAGRQSAARTLAIIADPVFEQDDPRVLAAARKKRGNGSIVVNLRSAGEAPRTGSLMENSDLARAARSFNRAGFSRLPFSREEADKIAELIPKSSRFKATGFKANRTLATSGELNHYRIVHFATHGLLNNEYPDLSGMILSLVNRDGKPEDGFLGMNDIYNMRLSADLVVLSACETALGKEIKGEGLYGLTRGFMYAGAQRVVASLWQVDDSATAELMASFYRSMLKEGRRPAAALREAQMEMMKKKRWSSPYFWAGFVIQGEWK